MTRGSKTDQKRVPRQQVAHKTKRQERSPREQERVDARRTEYLELVRREELIAKANRRLYDAIDALRELAGKPFGPGVAARHVLDAVEKWGPFIRSECLGFSAKEYTYLSLAEEDSRAEQYSRVDLAEIVGASVAGTRGVTDVPSPGAARKALSLARRKHEHILAELKQKLNDRAPGKQLDTEGHIVTGGVIPGNTS